MKSNLLYIKSINREGFTHAQLESLGGVIPEYQAWIDEEIEVAMAKLSERFRDVLRMRFWDRMTLREIAGILGVTHERIRQIEAKALRILRHPDNSKPLEEAIFAISSES